MSRMFMLLSAPGAVTRVPYGVDSFAWKPDGTGFAYTASPTHSARNKADDSFLTTAADPYRLRDIDQKWMEFFKERFKR